MVSPKIRFKVDNFRAIKSAEIILNGITVVSGENGSGKSSLSKLLYYSFKTSINFDLLIIKRLQNVLKDILRAIYLINSDFRHKNNIASDSPIKWNIRNELFNSGSKDIANWESKIKSYIEITKDFLQQSIEESKSIKALHYKLNRYDRIIEDVLMPDHIKEESNDEDLPQKLFNNLELLGEKISMHFKKSGELIYTRPLAVFNDELLNVFHENKIPNIKIEEYRVILNDKKSKRLLHTHSIQDIAYIDTPMIIGEEELNSDNKHWDDLIFLLKRKKKGNITDPIYRKFNKEIIKGEVIYKTNDFEDVFLYKREDGATFNLIECATGIKSFAILLMLLKNGVLHKNTLLIIDEPEAHLHPQWVVEYARLIVLLHKKLGVQFFIASHDPDMVSAIRYISEKEKVLRNVNFYLSVKDDLDEFKYHFKHLGSSIDEIFTSFNIALERISFYGPK